MHLKKKVSSVNMINILHIHESNNGKSFAYIIHVQEYKAVKRRELFGAKKGRF